METTTLPPAQVQFDTGPLLKMLSLVEKAIRKMPQAADLTPMVDALLDQSKTIQKTLAEMANKPAPVQKVIQKKFAQNYEGDWIVTEEPVNA